MISADHRRERWSSVRSSFGIRYFGTFRYPVRLVVSSIVRYSAQCSGFSSWMRFSHSIRQSSPFSFVFNFLIFVMTDECVERRGIFDEYCQWNPQIVSRRDTNQKEDHDGRWREDKPMMGERRARRAMERWRIEEEPNGGAKNNISKMFAEIWMMKSVGFRCLCVRFHQWQHFNSRWMSFGFGQRGEMFDEQKDLGNAFDQRREKEEERRKVWPCLVVLSIAWDSVSNKLAFYLLLGKPRWSNFDQRPQGQALRRNLLDLNFRVWNDWNLELEFSELRISANIERYSAMF